MLISPTEPFPIQALGTISPLPERAGVDVLMLSRKTRTGVQRKKFPEDLLSSLADGRLYQQLHQMAALDRAILLIEGFGRWTADGYLLDLHIKNFTKEQYWGLLNSVSFEFGVQVIQVRDINETLHYLRALEGWAQKEKHNSLRRRPGPRGDEWGVKGNRDYAVHLMQSFPGVGPDLAVRIVDKFGRAPLRWDVTVADLMSVPGVGKGKAAAMWRALEEGKGNG